MLISYKLGQTSIVLRVKILDSSVTTGAGKTGLAYNTAGLTIAAIADNEATTTAYTSAGSTIEDITTLGTYEAPTATKCRFKELDATNHPGVYEIHLANARYAVANAKSLLISIGGPTGAAETDAVIPLTSFDPYDGVRAGMTSLPNAVPGAAGGLLIAGTNAPVTITGSGNALTLQSTGANGAALKCIGNGSGHGADLGGGTTGDGIHAVGNTSGHGLYCYSDESGHGIYARSGLTGDGIRALGGATSGDGVHIEGPADGDGIYVKGVGTNQYGIYVEGYAGLYAKSTAANGIGIFAVGAGTNGAGIYGRCDDGIGIGGFSDHADGKGIQARNAKGIGLQVQSSQGVAFQISGITTGLDIDASDGPGVDIDGTTYGIDVTASAGDAIRAVGSQYDVNADVHGTIDFAGLTAAALQDIAQGIGGGIEV